MSESDQSSPRARETHGKYVAPDQMKIVQLLEDAKAKAVYFPDNDAPPWTPLTASQLEDRWHQRGEGPWFGGFNAPSNVTAAIAGYAASSPVVRTGSQMEDMWEQRILESANDSDPVEGAPAVATVPTVETAPSATAPVIASAVVETVPSTVTPETELTESEPSLERGMHTRLFGNAAPLEYSEPNTLSKCFNLFARDHIGEETKSKLSIDDKSRLLTLLNAITPGISRVALKDEELLHSLYAKLVANVDEFGSLDDMQKCVNSSLFEWSTRKIGEWIQDYCYDSGSTGGVFETIDAETVTLRQTMAGEFKSELSDDDHARRPKTAKEMLRVHPCEPIKICKHALESTIESKPESARLPIAKPVVASVNRAHRPASTCPWLESLDENTVQRAADLLNQFLGRIPGKVSITVSFKK